MMATTKQRNVDIWTVIITFHVLNVVRNLIFWVVQLFKSNKDILWTWKYGWWKNKEKKTEQYCTHTGFVTIVNPAKLSWHRRSPHTHNSLIILFLSTFSTSSEPFLPPMHHTNNHHHDEPYLLPPPSSTLSTHRQIRLGFSAIRVLPTPRPQKGHQKPFPLC